MRFQTFFSATERDILKKKEEIKKKGWKKRDKEKKPE
jgi:hypothetical protein